MKSEQILKAASMGRVLKSLLSLLLIATPNAQSETPPEAVKGHETQPAVTPVRMQLLMDLSSRLQKKLDESIKQGVPLPEALERIRRALNSEPQLVNAKSISVTGRGVFWKSTEGLGFVVQYFKPGER